MKSARYLGLFLSESREQLTRAYARVIRLEQSPRDEETLRALMRHVHSLKGMGATMGYGPMVELTHDLEDEFERAQGGGTVGCDTSLVHDALTRLGQIIDEIERSYANDERTVEAEAARRYRIDLRLAPPGAGQATRTVAALGRLGSLGYVESVSPPLLCGVPPRFDGRLSLRMRFPGSRDRLRLRLSEIEDIESFDVLASPAAPRLARQPVIAESWTQVRSDRLDRAAEQALELLAEHHRLRDVVGSGPTVSEALGRLESRTKELFGTITQMRLLPFSSIVQRLHQTAGELSQRLVKPVQLRIEGGDVQLDRSRLDALQDPLNHLLRNALDHGIESPECRRACGKPSRGTLILKLARRGARISISLEDDGRGLDPAALRRAAVSRGLLSDEQAANLTDEQSRMLITLPSFSTARHLSPISGRGVGMDLVRDAVERMGGYLLLHSHPGRGTRVELSLPRSQALLQVLVVRCAGQLFALPLSCLNRVCAAGDRPETVGVVPDLPAIRVDGLSAPRDEGRAGKRDATTLLLKLDDRQVGLVVDEIVGRREIVIRPLERPLDRLRQYSGAGVLEDGGIVLILDPHGL